MLTNPIAIKKAIIDKYGNHEKLTRIAIKISYNTGLSNTSIKKLIERPYNVTIANLYMIASHLDKNIIDLIKIIKKDDK